MYFTQGHLLVLKEQYNNFTHTSQFTPHVETVVSSVVLEELFHLRENDSDGVIVM